MKSFQFFVGTVARKIPFDDPDTLNYVRVGYVSVQLLVLSTYYYISMKVRACILIAHSVHILTSTSHKVKQKNDETVLKYGEFLTFYHEQV